MFKTGIKCTQCTCKSLPFKELTPEELILVNKSRVEITFKKGEALFKQGSMVSHIAFIRKGLVKVSISFGNQEMVLALEPPGKFSGLHSLYSGNVYPFSVVACEEVMICLIDINTIRALVQTNPKFSAALLKQFNDDILFAFERMKCLSLKQLNGRFADLLLCLGLRIYKRKKFSVPLSKKDMAMVTNMTQESLSRVIREFVQGGIIKFEGNVITILDFKKIKHLSLVG